MVSWQKNAVALLREAIAVDTSNPPGNELSLCRRFEEAARAGGLYTRIVETAAGRGNIIISPKEEWLCPTPTPPLILLSHLDVVPADSSQWSFEPFSGDIVSGSITGRGALDTKQLTVMHLSALLRCMEDSREHGADVTRPVVMIATSDEELGSTEGLLRLLEADEDFFRNSSVLSEGGGFPIRLKGKTVYLCESGQKGAAKVRIFWKKDPGGSPFFPDLAPAGEAADVVARISRQPWEFPPPDAVVKTLEHIADLVSVKGMGFGETMDGLTEITDGFISNLFDAMTKNTCTVTRLEGGRKNRIPEPGIEMEMFLDCRLLPGCTRGDLDSRIDDLLRGTGAVAEVLEFREGFISDHSSDVYESLEGVLRELNKDAEVVPFVSIGGSDGRFLAPLGARVYGWSPVLPDLTFDRVVKMVHGIDEKIPVDSFLFGCENIYRIVRKLIYKENDR